MSKSPIAQYALERASTLANAIRVGEVVACPAEGVWGLSCNPFDESAVRCLLKLKCRSVKKGLIIVSSDIETFEQVLSSLPEKIKRRVVSAWPGPVTWLVPNNGSFPEWITGDSSEVAIRVTSAPALAALCNAFSGPLVSSSANPTGLRPPQKMLEVRRYFGADLKVMPGTVGLSGKASTIRRAFDGSIIRP